MAALTNAGNSMSLDDAPSAPRISVRQFFGGVGADDDDAAVFVF